MRLTFWTALTGVFFLVSAGFASGADITIAVVKATGKCQVQQGSDWVPVTIGQALPVGATVSTGFRSELQLKVGPSTITVKALSRLVLKDLVQTGSDVKTDLYLKVGKIEAEVNKDETVTSNKFTVGSPVSTASVRGTAFSYDGVNLQVTRGLVDFGDLSGRMVSVPVGEAAKASESGQGIAQHKDIVAQESTTQDNTATDSGATDDTNTDSWGSFDGYDYSSLLDALNNGYDWSSEMPNVHISIGGIQP